MTITPTMSPKRNATIILLAGLGIVALTYLVNLLQQPPHNAGWRHDAQAAAPVALTAPVQTRGSTSGAAAATDSGETSAPRARN